MPSVRVENKDKYEYKLSLDELKFIRELLDEMRYMDAKIKNGFMQRIEYSLQKFGKDIRNDIKTTKDIGQGAIDRTQNNDGSHAKIQGIADRPQKSDSTQDSIQSEQQRELEKLQDSNSSQDKMEADPKKNNVMVGSSSPNKVIMLESELGDKAESIVWSQREGGSSSLPPNDKTQSVTAKKKHEDDSFLDEMLGEE